MKKQAGQQVGGQVKLKGVDKKLLAPGRPVAEVKKETSRVEGEGKEKGDSQKEKNSKEKENKEKGSVGVPEEKLGHTSVEEINPNICERAGGDGEKVEGGEYDGMSGSNEAGRGMLPVGVHDVDAYCDNREPHVSGFLIKIFLGKFFTLIKQLCSEYACSIYIYLRQLEAGNVIKKDFLKG